MQHRILKKRASTKFINICIMGSHNFKGATCGLYYEDHVSRDFPLYIFHKYHINICTGTMIKSLMGMF